MPGGRGQHRSSLSKAAGSSHGPALHHPSRAARHLRRHRDHPLDRLGGQGTYPAAATLARFVDLGLKQVPGTGLLPAVVPGAFDAWMLLLRDHGTWRLRDVLDYAIHYAQNGFPVLPRIAASILAARTFFAEQWPTSAPLWCP